MICEDDIVQQADIVVLPPAQVDELSDCELIDDNDLLTNDMLPDDVAGDVEVQYEAISEPNEDYTPEKKRAYLIGSFLSASLFVGHVHRTRGLTKRAVKLNV